MTAPKSAAELAEAFASKFVGRDEQAKLDLKNGFLAGHAAGIAEGREERDAYAKAMAIALREGIFPSKADTKRKITEVLARFKALAGVGHVDI